MGDKIAATIHYFREDGEPAEIYAMIPAVPPEGAPFHLWLSCGTSVQSRVSAVVWHFHEVSERFRVSIYLHTEKI